MLRRTKMQAPSMFWTTITRLGEAQILLPVFLLLAAWSAVRLNAGRAALAWTLCIGVAALLTTLTKVAFIGFGAGVASINFTGISGHAMFSAAVLPLLLVTAASTATARVQRLAGAAGYALAGIVGVSRLMVDAHSVSEVIAGLALGSLASGLALAVAAAPRTRTPHALAVVLVLWLGITPAAAPPSRTHDWVTRLSLAVSGRDTPYTRAELLAGARPGRHATGD